MKVTRAQKKKIKLMEKNLHEIYGTFMYGYLLALMLDGFQYFAGERDYVEVNNITVKFNGGYPTTLTFKDEGNEVSISHYEARNI